MHIPVRNLAVTELNEIVVYICLTWDSLYVGSSFGNFTFGLLFTGEDCGEMPLSGFLYTVNGNRKTPPTHSSAQELNLHALNLHLEKLIFFIELERECECPVLSRARKQNI